MNVASLKSGKRGRPAFRRFNGVIVGTSSGVWDFWPADWDLFGADFVHLAVPGNFPRRVFSRIISVLHDGRDCEVTIAMTGKSHVGFNGEIFYDFRFVSFPTSVGMSRRVNA